MPDHFLRCFVQFEPCQWRRLANRQSFVVAMPLGRSPGINQAHGSYITHYMRRNPGYIEAPYLPGLGVTVVIVKGLVFVDRSVGTVNTRDDLEDC